MKIESQIKQIICDKLFMQTNAEIDKLNVKILTYVERNTYSPIHRNLWRYNTPIRDQLYKGI